jgi:polyisoprenoid-binding protein YceI
MKTYGFIGLLLSALIISILVGNRFTGTTAEPNITATVIGKEINPEPGVAANSATTTDAVAAADVAYRIIPSQSRFMANVGSGGLLWFMGHTHHFAVRDFTGEATFTPSTLVPASLQMTIKTGSLEETGKIFTEQQKQIINKEARDEVLEASQYPEITFKSTTVTGKMKSEGQYDVKIAGDLTVHGVTRPVEIPAQVTVNANTLKATGEFSINRSDYKVKTKAIKGGTIRVRNKVTFEFDITATNANAPSDE